MYKQAKKIFLCLTTLVSSNVIAMNFLRPYDTLFWRNWRPDHCVTFRVFAEAGVGCARSFNEFGCPVNVLQIFETEQNAIAMLDGFPANSPITSLRNALPVSSDDPINGKFLVDGQFQMDGAGALAFWFGWADQFALSIYLPFFGMKLKNVRWCDQTQNITVEQELTNNFFENVCELGDGLSLTGWSRRGVGDLVTMIHWMRDFPQQRPLLKQVSLNARLGFNFPTGLRRDENKIMAIPFGYDGAMGIIFAGGLDARIGCYVQMGVDVELLYLFGDTRDRRIKTDRAQTDLLLLAKTCAYKDFGFSQKFSLYVEFDQLVDRFSFLVGYQFFKHSDDDIWLATQDFSQEVANTSAQLREWTMHQAMMILSYDAPSITWHNYELSPSVSLYARIPVNGRNSVLVSAIGATFSIDF